MGKLSLIVAAKEPEYVRRLAEYIREAPAGAEWQMTACTQPQALRQYVRGGYPADLLLLQPEFEAHVRDVVQEALPVVHLVPFITDSGKPQIVQFQSLPRLIQQLNMQLSHIRGFRHKAGQPESAIMLSLFSSMGGMGKTTLALNIAREASEAGKRVFYFNLEPYNASDLYLRESGEGSEQDYSMLLYVLQSKPDQVRQQLAASTRRSTELGIDYFAPAASPEERQALTSGLVALTIRAIVDSGEYDLVVADMGGRLDEVGMELLRSSHLPLWLTGGDATSQRKMDIMLQFGAHKWGEAFVEATRKIRMIQVYNSMARAAVAPQEQYRTDQAMAAIPYVPEWREVKDPMQMLASPVYRGVVQRIIRDWIWPEGGEACDRGGGAWAAQAYPGTH
ncbi:hypothetical protein [Paenibacillus pinihumi]|uniref:hypothetical protein n=1 Tax=Paenibacillus pinihumi TaxID=669462 RepID=UPI0003F500E0|nr:hypothetical protein [Paenibacillus pinihumi]